MKATELCDNHLGYFVRRPSRRIDDKIGCALVERAALSQQVFHLRKTTAVRVPHR